MKEIVLIEIISFASFIYSLVSLFYGMAPNNEMLLVFFFTVGISTFYARNKNRSKIYKVSILFLLLPLFYFKELGARYFIISSAILIFLYVENTVDRGRYSDYVSRFKYSLMIFAVAIYIRFLLGNLTGLMKDGVAMQGVSGSLVFAAPFIIIYIVSTVLLNRSIRHREFNDDIRNIRRTNIKYLIATGIFLLINSIDQIKSFIIGGFGKIIDLFIVIIYYPMHWLTKNIDLGSGDYIQVEEELSEGLGELGLESMEGSEGVFQENAPMDFTIMRRIIGFILIIVLIYLVYRLFMKSNEKKDSLGDYREEREYMARPKKKRKAIFQSLRYPKDIKDQIRFYYRKYLRKVDKADIQVLDSDTSEDINEKAKLEFGDSVESIRNIYIESRYGNKDQDIEDLEKIKSLYKNL